MSIANARGGFFKSITILQNDSNETSCMLKEAFLKKSENYSVQLTDFIVNKSQPINLELGKQLTIRVLPGCTIVPRYAEHEYTFTPRECLNVLDYVVQLQDFFKRFSQLFWRLGLETVPGEVGILGLTIAQTADLFDNVDRGARPINFVRSNTVLHGGIDTQEGYVDDELLVSCQLTDEMELSITMSSVFQMNFFIELEDTLSKRLGFLKYLFAVNLDVAGDGVLVKQTTGLFQAGGILFSLFVDNRAVWASATQTKFLSTHTVRSLDERISLDVVSVFPHGTRITTVDGKETRDFLLARFDLSNTKHFYSKSFQDHTRMLGTSEITEEFNAGIFNLTRSNPDYESNLFLNGDIQFVRLVLQVRYFQDNEIKTVNANMYDGFFSCRVLFTKKI